MRRGCLGWNVGLKRDQARQVRRCCDPGRTRIGGASKYLKPGCAQHYGPADHESNEEEGLILFQSENSSTATLAALVSPGSRCEMVYLTGTLRHEFQ